MFSVPRVASQHALTQAPVGAKPYKLSGVGSHSNKGVPVGKPAAVHRHLRKFAEVVGKIKNSAAFFGVAGIALGLSLGTVLPQWPNDAVAPGSSLAQTVDGEGPAKVHEKDITATAKSMGRGNSEEGKSVSPVSFRTPGGKPGLETGAAPHPRVRYASPTSVIPEAMEEAAPPAKVSRAKSSRHAAASSAVPTPVRKEVLPKAGSNRTTIAAAVVPVPTVGIQERSSTSRTGKGKSGKLTNAEAELAAAASILAAAQLR